MDTQAHTRKAVHTETQVPSLGDRHFNQSPETSRDEDICEDGCEEKQKPRRQSTPATVTQACHPSTRETKAEDEKFEVILGYTGRSCLKNLKLHYGCENARSTEGEKALEGLLADGSQQTEGSAETTERGCEHTGHTRHEQPSSEEQDGQGNGAKSKQAHHRGP